MLFRSNPIQNNLNLYDNTGFNSNSQSLTDMVQSEQSDYSDYFSATDENIASTSYTTYTTSNYDPIKKNYVRKVYKKYI